MNNPEVIAAINKLEDAIENLMEVTDSENEGLLVDWVLLTAQHLDKGEYSATVNGMYGPINQRLYQVAGLLDYGKSRVNYRFSKMMD